MKSLNSIIIFVLSISVQAKVLPHIDRQPSSFSDSRVRLSGSFRGAKIVYATGDAADISDYSSAQSIAVKTCAYLGWTLDTFQESQVFDVGVREEVEVMSITNGNFKMEKTKKFATYDQIICVNELIDDCQFQSHGSDDVFFIEARRKRNCKEN